jgi:hypothetical protein
MTCPLTIFYRVVDIYKELRRYKSLEDIPADRLAVLKGSNLYAIYMRIANIDQYDFDLFKAIFEYKIFSKYLAIYPLFPMKMRRARRISYSTLYCRPSLRISRRL